MLSYSYCTLDTLKHLLTIFFAKKKCFMNEFYKTNHHYALQAPHNVREIDLYANLRWSGGLVVLFRFFFAVILHGRVPLLLSRSPAVKKVLVTIIFLVNYYRKSKITFYFTVKFYAKS